MTIDGTLTFDRNRNLIMRMEVKRKEKRDAGFVEPGLDFQGTMNIKRTPTDVPAELGDTILASFPRDDPPAPRTAAVQPA